MRLTKNHDHRCNLVIVAALVAVSCLSVRLTWTQSVPVYPRNPAVQIEPMQPTTQENAAPVFIGKIIRSGNKLVLSTSDATYQLDDQRQVQRFLNQTVRIAGVLDAESGTICVSAIRPASLVAN